MLNKLPVRVMEGILALLEVTDYLQLVKVSTQMQKIVEETPKKYKVVKCGIEKDTVFCLYFNNYGSLVRQIKGSPVKSGFGKKLEVRDRVDCRKMLKVFLSNATVEQLHAAPLDLGVAFWCSLNMKVTRITDPTDVLSVLDLQLFLGISFPCFIHLFMDGIKPTELVYNNFFMDIEDAAGNYEDFFRSELVCSLEKLQILDFSGYFASLISIRARDLCIGLFDENEFDSLHTFTYLRRRIDGWLQGNDEIQMIQIDFYLDVLSPLIAWIVDNLSPELGWIDRTYHAMPLILRASDGEALLAYRDDVDDCLYLIRSEYNFRRGRCLGSYEKNEKSIRKIADLMRIASQLSAIRPALAEDAKEKLREECIEFNQYNKGATKMDLLTDSIWRPEGYRLSPWRRGAGRDPRGITYPIDRSLRHAYQFTKAFEERGVLPDVDQFKPATNNAGAK